MAEAKRYGSPPRVCIAVIARKAALLARIARLPQPFTLMSWPHLWPCLHSHRPPSVLLIDTDELERGTLLLLQNAFISGLLPPTAVCCGEADEHSFERAWAVQRIQARLILPSHDIAQVVSQMVAVPTTPQYVLARLKALYPTDCPAVNAALDVLAEDIDAVRGTASRLARRVGLSRSALYVAFAEASLPSPDKVRLLFSVDAAFQAFARAASPSRAAECAGYSSVRSLRSAAARIGLSVTDLRQPRDRSCVFDQWLRWVVEHPQLSRAQ